METLGKSHRQIITFNNEIGYSYVPNLKARLINSEGGYFIRTNSQGFRSDIEYEIKKKKKQRILFFGDSNTAGDGVGNLDRFSELLGKHFDAEIFNYALSGSGTDQQYLIWKKYAEQVEADLIIIGTLVENIERNKVKFRETTNYFDKKSTLTSKPYFKIKDEKLKLFNVPVERFDGNYNNIKIKEVQWGVPYKQKRLYQTINFLRNNKIFQAINNKYEKKLSFLRSFLIKNFYQPFDEYNNIESDGYKLMQKILEKFLTSIKNTPIILMPIPTYHYYFDGAKPIYKKFFNSFENKKNNIFVFDPLKDLRQLKFDEKKLLPLSDDKSHFSKYGHKKIANFLCQKIEEQKLLNNKFNNNKYIVNNIDKPIYILGISAFYHDSAATLIKDGKIVSAAQEERFTRIKNDQSFPKFAINYCLEEAGINPNELSAIVFYDNGYLSLERIMWSYAKTVPSSLESWKKYMPRWLTHKFFVPKLIREHLKYTGKILHNDHHRSHLASAFFPSPFKKSAILTIDGVGEWTTASIGIGDGNKLNMLKEISFPNSVGLLYSAFTQFLGFKVNSGEYKMMGLAPYGKPIYEDLIMKNLVNLKEDGSIIINQDFFSYLSGTEMTNEKFSQLFKIKPRISESRISQIHMDIASSIQKVTEKIIFNMAKYTKKITGEENLCLSGGVALNCVANGFLLKSGLFKNIWIQPASGDAGSSLGCAYDAYYSYLGNDRSTDNQEKLSSQLGSMFGPAWSADELKAFLETAKISYQEFKSLDDRNKSIASFLKNGKVIGLFQGRTEFGPRALGSRSIIGDARNKDMQARLNLKIKFRESFRPFAPAILCEKVSEFFELNQESPYMMLVAKVNKDRRKAPKKIQSEDMLKIVKEIRSEIPAITHVDYSARIQTVDKKNNLNLYEIIKEFENQTNCPLIINTSFNVRGEPIVNSPNDAYKCFMNTNMDILILENFLIKKDKQGHNLKDWKISEKSKETIKLKKTKIKELEKVYSNLKNIKISQNYNLDGWNDTSNLDLKDIFEIPIELDANNFVPEKMSKAIIRYWRDEKFGKEMLKTITELLILAKSKKIKNLELDENLSENMYEMF